MKTILPTKNINKWRVNIDTIIEKQIITYQNCYEVKILNLNNDKFFLQQLSAPAHIHDSYYISLMLKLSNLFAKTLKLIKILSKYLNK